MKLNRLRDHQAKNHCNRTIVPLKLCIKISFLNQHIQNKLYADFLVEIIE